MQGLTLCFTGPAVDHRGNSVLRADLKARAEDFGFVVKGSVTQAVQVLVASRIDTVKARKAKDRGMIVITYPDFIQQSLGGSVPHQEGSILVPVVDSFDYSDVL